jgi:hypothetical protein
LREGWPGESIQDEIVSSDCFDVYHNRQIPASASTNLGPDKVDLGAHHPRARVLVEDAPDHGESLWQSIQDQIVSSNCIDKYHNRRILTSASTNQGPAKCDVGAHHPRARVLV